MNIETVNELIQSLESAGELSIREQKFLKLAKEFRICSASLDAAIKTGNMLADQNSQLAAENVGLVNRSQQLMGIIQNADNDYCMCGDLMKIHVLGGCGHPTGMFDYYYNKWLEEGDETPATDRIYAGIKADGVEEFAEKLRIPGDDPFMDAVADGVAGAADSYAKQLREGAK